ncbi:MAG: cytochrome b/b6 domain-containing protein [Pseudomonadota bacterium]
MSLLNNKSNDITEEQAQEPDLQKTQQSSLKVWDLPVRIFHWGLVIAFVAAYITNLLGVNYFKYHVWCGYTVIILVLFRIIWGVVGTYHAKFIHFVRSPFATTKYALSIIKKADKHYAGHNPLGALMVLVLLLALLIQAITGLFSNDEIFNLGPLYGYVDNDLSLALTEIHQNLFYWILGAVILHIIAVCLHIFFKRDNIIKAMVTGEKSNKGLENETAITSSRIGLAIIIAIILAITLAWVIYSAPEIVTDFG